MTAAGHDPERASRTLAERIAERVLEHPSVRELDAGEFGTVATYLPGRRVTGVRSGEEGEPVEVAVVLRLDRPLPDVVAEIRDAVAAVAGPGAVDVTVSDVVPTDDTTEPEG